MAGPKYALFTQLTRRSCHPLCERFFTARVWSNRATAAACLLALAGQTGCAGIRYADTKVLAPPPAPAQQLPKLAFDPPPEEEGAGRVFFDVTDGSAEIYDIPEESTSSGTTHIVTVNGSGTGFSREYGARTKFVCRTRCAANLAYGQHQIQVIRNGKTDFALVTAGVKPSAFRHTMGEFKPASGGQLGLTASLWYIGITGLVVGGTALAAAEDKAVGAVVRSGSAAMIGGSHVIGLQNYAVSRPGSYVQWQLPAVSFLSKKKHRKLMMNGGGAEPGGRKRRSRVMGGVPLSRARMPFSVARTLWRHDAADESPLTRKGEQLGKEEAEKGDGFGRVRSSRPRPEKRKGDDSGDCVPQGLARR